jgi:anti-sigma regulatory factor (Ser/Thr protein kinase)
MSSYPRGQPALRDFTHSALNVELDLHLVNADQLGSLRGSIRAWAQRHGFTGLELDHVILAVYEVATNGLVHGAPPVRIRAWRHGETLIVQADDAGGRPIPPTAGYLPPPPSAEGGQGLWLARQVTDALLTHTAAGMTSVRLHFPCGVNRCERPLLP